MISFQVTGVTRRTRLAACFLLGLLPASAVAQQPGSGPSAPVSALNAALQQLEANSAQGFAARYNALAPVIDRAFDLQQILQSSVGLRWASLPDAQKTRLLAVFRAYTIANYVANFDKNAGDTFRLLPETRAVGKDTVVETEIVPKSGDPTRLDYVMRQGAHGWQAVDVLQTGTISQAAVQRSDFRRLLAGGSGAENLIASLEQKVQNFSGGAIKP